MPTRAQLSKIKEQQGAHTGLMRAALSGDIKTLKVLAGTADVNERDAEGRTPLMFAAINRETECGKELLRHRADVNAKANDGGTALMLAASSGDAELVKAFLARGADVSATYSETGQTALMLAKDHGYDDIVELLQASDAKQ
jgi:ankyrin repeat protein